jgi:hypothetical protein
MVLRPRKGANFEFLAAVETRPSIGLVSSHPFAAPPATALGAAEAVGKERPRAPYDYATSDCHSLVRQCYMW